MVSGVDNCQRLEFCQHCDRGIQIPDLENAALLPYPLVAIVTQIL